METAQEFESIDSAVERSRFSGVALHNRRYLGGKQEIVPFIVSTIEEVAGPFSSFCDVFAGTGVVAAAFNQPGRAIHANDLLAVNETCLRAWFSPEPFDPAKVIDALEQLDRLKPTGRGATYMRKHFGGKYYEKEVAAEIGAIRDEIDRCDLSGREREIVLAALIYAADRIAHTCGHFDTYRKGRFDARSWLTLRVPLVFSSERNRGNVITRLDGNRWVRKHDVDVIYMDPPYNSRQYANNYHLLENLTRWKFPPVKGRAAKFIGIKRIRSEYNLSRANLALEDLVKHARCKHLFLSYNNMGDKGHCRSNARISDEEIHRIMSLRGPMTCYTTASKHFDAGRRKIDDHQERLFHCRVVD